MERHQHVVLGGIVMLFGLAVLVKGAVPIETFHVGEVSFGLFGLGLGFFIAIGNG